MLNKSTVHNPIRPISDYLVKNGLCIFGINQLINPPMYQSFYQLTYQSIYQPMYQSIDPSIRVKLHKFDFSSAIVSFSPTGGADWTTMDGSGTEYYSHIVQNQPIITYFKQMSKDISNSIKLTRNNTKFRSGQRAYFMERLKLRLQTDHNRRKRIVSSNMFKSL